MATHRTKKDEFVRHMLGAQALYDALDRERATAQIALEQAVREADTASANCVKAMEQLAAARASHVETAHILGAANRRLRQLMWAMSSGCPKCNSGWVSSSGLETASVYCGGCGEPIRLEDEAPND